MVTSPLLLLVSLGVALACSPAPPEQWETFQAHVLYKHNHPASVSAKEWMKRNFCHDFSINPCEVSSGSPSTLHIFEDFGISIPRSMLSKVVPWLQQRRAGHLGGGYDLDLAIHPLSGCPTLDVANFTLFAGHRYPFNTNALSQQGRGLQGSSTPGYCYLKYSSQGATSKSGVYTAFKGNGTCSYKKDTDIQNSAGGKALAANSEDHCCALCGEDSKCMAAVFAPSTQPSLDNSWAFQCSSDASQVCATPYANNTSCSSVSKAFHLHLYYVNNNPKSVQAKETFHNAAASAFNIPSEVCPDYYGHEQPHSSTCWLTGPMGTESTYPQDMAGSSFVAGTHSLYIVEKDYNDMVPWLMANINAQYVGEDLDFLFHPCFGCNFADHQLWALHGGKWWVNNKHGIADEGGYTGSSAPSIDTQSSAYPRPTCTPSTPTSYSAHVIYNPTSPGGKDSFVSQAKQFGSLVADSPKAWADPASPFLAGEAEISIAPASLPAFLDWALPQRAALSVDLLLVPHTGCPYGDYLERSMYAGNGWQFNEQALLKMTSRKADVASSAIAATPTTNYVLYMMYAANNAWQAAAVDAMAESIAYRFGLSRKECTSQYPTPEPHYSKLCLMEEERYPYKEAQSPMTMGYAGLYIPASSLGDVLPFVMEHHSASSAGYEVDLLLVPLRGSPASDYASALKAGNSYRLNSHAL